MSRSVVLVCSALALLAAPARADAPALATVDARPPDPVELLRGAFDNQYGVDFTSTVELVIRDRHGRARRRRFEAASKIIDDRLHSIGRLVHPDHLRGMTILQIEGDDHHDAFVYLPSMRAVRRISLAQRGDAFFGTDVTYEDLERRRARDYEILDFAPTRVGDEPAFRIRARPRHTASYDEIGFWIAAADAAILRVAYFKRGDPEPFRRVEAPRTAMHTEHGHTLPTRLRVENRTRGTTTDVRYEHLAIAPEIDDRVFSIRTLEQKGRIPGVED